MTSRVFNPIRSISAREGREFQKQTGSSEVAYLGNGEDPARVLVEANDDLQYSKVYIRFKDDSGANNGVNFTPPLRARVEGDLPLQANLEVRVVLDRVSSTYVVKGVAYEALNRRGVNTLATYNAAGQSFNNYFLHRIRNLRLFFPSNSTKASVEDYLYIHNGILKNASKGQSDNIEFSTYIPSDGNERLVGAALNPDSNTIELVSGTIRTILNSPWSLAYLQELVDGFSFGAIPMQVVRLQGGQTAITNGDIIADLRQVFSSDIAGSGSSSNQVIDGDRIIPSGKDAFFAGTLNIISGTLTIAGELYVL